MTAMLPLEILLIIFKLLSPVKQYQILTLLRSNASRISLFLILPQLSIGVAAWKGNISLVSYWRDFLREDLENCNPVIPIDYAGVAGHIHVLDWWVENELPFDYTSRLFVAASKDGNIQVLDWFLRNNKPLVLNPSALCEAAAANQIEVLEWWLERNLPNPLNGMSGKQKFEAIKSATIFGNVALLNIWRRFGLKLKNPKN
ncbi:hypothetical protein HK098_005258 [Nowakowskiella sp. JEL0407]|nr:hypothetical protein HK098_005258 [Nowakowskiella sp. JEL0407]